jgi:hypothetical protein
MPSTISCKARERERELWAVLKSGEDASFERERFFCSVRFLNDTAPSVEGRKDIGRHAQQNTGPIEVRVFKLELHCSSSFRGYDTLSKQSRLKVTCRKIFEFEFKIFKI